MPRTPGSPRAPTARPSPWLVGLAFTVSGFTSLVLEIVWSKALALLLGSTLHAVSTVVATYLAGLALGAWIAGRAARRVRRPLRLYGYLEMGVGAYALVSLLLIRAMDPIAGSLYAGLGATSAAYLAARVVLAAAVLLVPTMLSGAVALVFEIPLTRGFGLVFGSSVYSFALVLATYLLGLAIGSLALGGRLAAGKDPWRAFAILQGGVAAGAALGLWLLPSLPK